MNKAKKEEMKIPKNKTLRKMNKQIFKITK